MENFDLLSNLFYVDNYKKGMMILSKYISSIDRYRPETLHVIGKLMNNDSYLRQMLLFLQFSSTSLYF